MFRLVNQEEDLQNPKERKVNLMSQLENHVGVRGQMKKKSPTNQKVKLPKQPLQLENHVVVRGQMMKISKRKKKRKDILQLENHGADHLRNLSKIQMRNEDQSHYTLNCPQ